MSTFAMGAFMGTWMSSIINSYHSPPSNSYLCQGTEHDKDGIKCKVSRCIACGKDYCDTCWDRVDPHKDQSSRTTHERNEPILVDMLNDVLSAKKRTVEQKQIIHQEDAKNLWFGVTESDGKQYIYEGPSYENLILDNVALQPWGIYPGLVTFVGETGAGKSALIKLLIDFGLWEESQFPISRSTNISKFLIELKQRATPVVGNIIADEFTPTSADVHLYADPKSQVFYADCEGLAGGEQAPIAAQCTVTSDHILLERVDRFTPKEIEWAGSGRQNVVQRLYPRLLYSFSDTIVFVLDNPKKYEKVITKLVDWGHQVIEKACNQSVLPHAVIALNKSPTQSDDSNRWDPVQTTKALLETAQVALKKNNKLREKVEFWSSRNVTINTIEDLLKCYYASITAIRVPNGEPPMLVESQITKLYKIIATKCGESQEKRREVRMQLNAVDLQIYLRKAFDHFAVEVDKPFDFVKAAFEIHPDSANFGLASSISRLADILQKCLGYPKGSTVWSLIIPFAASCMVLSAYRLNVADRGNPDGIFRHFWDDCEKAVREFYDKKMRCEYSSKLIRACVNVRTAHLKGHQGEDGELEGGEWIYSQTCDEFVGDVKNQLKTEVEHVAAEYRRIHSNETEEEDELRNAYRCHQEMIRQLQTKLGEKAADFGSHFICLSCLMEAPEHALPCGHTLCTPCISAVGKPLGSGFFEADSCPLHSVGESKSPLKLQTPYRASVKPAQAGVRVLTLDGGGIRGIVELKILRAIELELDDKIPIQAFFDLIVGTSTGGIISLGLGHEGWTVEFATTRFKELAKDAFKQHRLGKFSELVSGTKYRTASFTSALEEAFSKDAVMFGGTKAVSGLRTKTAVVTTTPTGQVTLLNNYNRRVSANEHYRFIRGADHSDEVKTHESARATSAAPWYWEVYNHEASGQVYLDGGLSHNNPIRIADSEQKSLWPEKKYNHPDILLSIGTGYENVECPPAISRTISSVGALTLLRTGWSLGSQLLEEQLDSERIWREWINTRMPPPEHQNRYRRINLPLDFKPQMDRIDEIDEYEKLISEYLNEIRHDIRAIAHQLIASCFYFRFEKMDLQSNGERWTCKGQIECRLPPRDPISKRFGEILEKLSQEIKAEKVEGVKASLPGLCFCVTEMHLDRNDVHYLDQNVIDNMRESGLFAMSPIEITITSEAAETNIFMLLHSKEGGQIPISGFPRNLLKDFPETYRKKKQRSEKTQRSEKDTKEPAVELIRELLFQTMIRSLNPLMPLDPLLLGGARVSRPQLTSRRLKERLERRSEQSATRSSSDPAQRGFGK